MDFDLESNALEIKTDSELGSDNKSKVKFFSSQYDESIVGGFNLYFSSTIKYRIRNCDNQGYYTEFPARVPTVTSKTWRITLSETTANRQIVIHCNNVEVLNVVLSDTRCRYTTWKSDWSKTVARIYFSVHDTASRFYRQEPGTDISNIYCLK